MNDHREWLASEEENKKEVMEDFYWMARELEFKYLKIRERDGLSILVFYLMNEYWLGVSKRLNKLELLKHYYTGD